MKINDIMAAQRIADRLLYAEKIRENLSNFKGFSNDIWAYIEGKSAVKWGHILTALETDDGVEVNSQIERILCELLDAKISELKQKLRDMGVEVD